jgi:hypothetical protein
MGILAVVPFVAVRFPPINDYPSHLARIVILARLNDPVFSHYYKIGSFLLPNIALDAVATPLALIFGPELAVRFFVESTLVLMLLGAVALHASAYRRFSPWPLLAFVFLHNEIFRFGFFNYLFGVGLALLAGAVWNVLPRSFGRLAFSFFSGIVLMFCHLEAFGVFAIIVAGSELAVAGRDWYRFKSWKPIATLIVSALPFFLVLLLFRVLSPTATAGAGAIQYAPGLGTKPVEALFSLSSGIVWLDVVTALVLAGVLLVLYWRRSLVLSWGLATASVLALFVFLATPEVILGALYVDSRLGPVLATLLVLSFGLRDGAPRREVLFVAAVAVGLAIFRVAALTSDWVGYDREIGSIVQSFDTIEPGATLFAATTQPFPRIITDTHEKRAIWQPPLKHVASYAVLLAPVFVPEIWNIPTQQPLIVQKPFQVVKMFQSSTPQLVDSTQALASFSEALDAKLSGPAWPNLGAVYLLVIKPEALKPFRVPAAFRIVVKGEGFILLRWSGARPSLK